jgi:hypothetical protein
VHLRRDILDILRPEIEGGFDLAGVCVADFDRVSGRWCHSELGKMSSGRTFATVIGAAGEIHCREKQTYKIAHLSHRKSAEIRLPRVLTYTTALLKGETKSSVSAAVKRRGASTRSSRVLFLPRVF